MTETNSEDPDAKDISYDKFPKFYVWNKAKRSIKRRASLV